MQRDLSAIPQHSIQVFRASIERNGWVCHCRANDSEQKRISRYEGDMKFSVIRIEGGRNA